MLSNQFDQSLLAFLRLEVPREIQAVLDRGGTNDRDWAWLRQEPSDDPNEECPVNILARADEFLLYPKDREKGVRGLLIFRKTITILSFVPGGIRIFGLRFSPTIAGFVEDCDW